MGGIVGGVNPGSGAVNTGSNLLSTQPFGDQTADMSGGFVNDQGGFGSLDDPTNVVGDPFFDPVFGSERMGGGDQGFQQDPTASSSTRVGAPEQQSQEPQPTSAAGGPRPTEQQQQQTTLGSSLKQLINQFTGGGQQSPGWMQQKDQRGRTNPLATVASLLSGGQQQPGQKPQATPQQEPGATPQAPAAGPEGGGAPVVSPPTPQAAPSPAFPPPPTPGQPSQLPAGLQNQEFSPGLLGTAQAAMAAPPAVPTPQPAAAPGQGAGPGAAPSAATGAAPVDPQFAAITGAGQVPAGSVRAPIAGAAPAGTTAPSQQDLSHSRMAGTSTQPTAGFSPYLARQRAPYAREIENPRTALKVATMMSFESDRDPVAVAESLQNRTEYSKSTIDNMVSPRFYGPMRKPRMWNRRMAELQRDPARMQKYLNAFKTAAAGSNLLGGATDQGSGRDPNVNWRGGRVIRHGETYNDWGGGPGGHSGAARFREEQQRNVRGGEQSQQPQQVAQAFDPQGSGYDEETARRSGLGPDETGHWPSRDPSTGQILKGQQHKSYNLTREGEEKAGYEIKQGDDGRYYSYPRSNNPFPGDVGTGAGQLPRPPALDFIERQHQQRMRDQGIEPSRRGERGTAPITVADRRGGRTPTPRPRPQFTPADELQEGQEDPTSPIGMGTGKARADEGYRTDPKMLRPPEVMSPTQQNMPTFDPNRYFQQLRTRDQMSEGDLLDWLIRQAMA